VFLSLLGLLLRQPEQHFDRPKRCLVAQVRPDQRPSNGFSSSTTSTFSPPWPRGKFCEEFLRNLALRAALRKSVVPAWSESLRQAGFSEHLVRHLSAMAELTRQGRYDRMTDTMCKLTGEAPTNMRGFVKLHAAEFKQRGPGQ
jgi:hypothetical protein